MRLIDTHHHIVPTGYLKKMAEGGKYLNALGKPFPAWSEQQMLDMMDKEELSIAIVSPPEPGPAMLNEAYDKALAVEFNDYSAELIARNPKRLGAFAMLPLPHIDITLKEIERCLDTLKFD